MVPSTKSKNDCRRDDSWQSDHKQLAMLGVSIDEETGIPNTTKDNMMTDVPGLYIAGVIAAGHNANKIFIETVGNTDI